jgi:hypothetical protein
MEQRSAAELLFAAHTARPGASTRAAENLSVPAIIRRSAKRAKELPLRWFADRMRHPSAADRRTYRRIAMDIGKLPELLRKSSALP